MTPRVEAIIESAEVRCEYRSGVRYEKQGNCVVMTLLRSNRFAGIIHLYVPFGSVTPEIQTKFGVISGAFGFQPQDSDHFQLQQFVEAIQGTPVELDEFPF